MATQSKQKVEHEVKEDCFGFDTEIRTCTVMTETLCARKKCSFYKHKEEVEGV